MKIETSYNIDDNTTGIAKLSIEYIQNADCEAENQDDVQSITIESEFNGSDYYYTIKTDRWAIDSSAELKELIEDFESRLFKK